MLRRMTPKSKLRRKIEREHKVLADLQQQVAGKEAFIRGLENADSFMPSDEEGNGSTELRPGSNVAKARDVLKKAGKPIHIKNILPLIGLEVTTRNQRSVANSIRAYVRKNLIFKRTGPATFGLINDDDPQEGRLGYCADDIPPPPEDYNT